MDELVRQEFVKLYFEGQVLNSSLSQVCKTIADKLQIPVEDCKHNVSIMIEEIVFDVV